MNHCYDLYQQVGGLSGFTEKLVNQLHDRAQRNALLKNGAATATDFIATALICKSISKVNHFASLETTPGNGVYKRIMSYVQHFKPVTVARDYAQELLGAAKENNTVDSIRKKLRGITNNSSNDNFSKNPSNKSQLNAKVPVKAGPHGVYQDAPYHTKNGNAWKSKAPIDGQKALDNSFKVDKPDSRRRIGISNGEFVVLDQTRPGLFHGHVRIWEELEREMRAPLMKAGLVTSKGKIKK
jgi:hypothetical protein